MSDQDQNQTPGEQHAPDEQPASTEVEPARTGYTLRGRKWLFGATLAAAGLVVGSGATYAITASATPDQTQSTTQGGPGGGGRGERGAPPDGTLPSGAPSDGTANGTAPGETAPSSAPSADSSTGTG